MDSDIRGFMVLPLCRCRSPCPGCSPMLSQHSSRSAARKRILVFLSVQVQCTSNYSPMDSDITGLTVLPFSRCRSPSPPWLQSDVRTLLGFRFSLLLLLAMLAAEMDTVSPGKMWSAQCRVATVSVISWSTTTAGTELSATGSLDPPLLSLPARRSSTDTTRHS